MLWFKAFHIIAVVTWFAGLFYLPRLFVYHSQAIRQSQADACQSFAIMERRLYRFIMLPSLVLVWFFGLATYGHNAAYYAASYWMWMKLALVASLVVYHFMCGWYVKLFAAQKPVPSARYFRWFNEYPSLVLVVVVLLVVLRPEVV